MGQDYYCHYCHKSLECCKCDGQLQDDVSTAQERIAELEEQVIRLMHGAPPPQIIFSPDDGAKALATLCECKQNRISALEQERDEARKLCRTVWHRLMHGEGEFEDLQEAVHKWEVMDEKV